MFARRHNRPASLGSFWGDDSLRVFSLTAHVLTLTAWWRGVKK